MITKGIQKAVEGENLTSNEARAVMEQIMNGEATDAQIGGFLVAMRMKGETVEEITAFTQVMREKATHIDPGKRKDVLDTCGTGGDRAHTFNISTVAAFVAAGAGIAVAKHGNRSVSSQCGSADVLKELGINIDITPERVSECLQQVGIAFLFAPKLHSSMKYAIGPRRELGIRTFFNILGPMTNPAGANRQLIGVYSADLVDKMAGVLAELGSVRAFVVHGCDGLDEITTTRETIIAEVRNGLVLVSTINPGDFGVERSFPGSLTGGDAAENAVIFRSVLSGEKGPKRDIVLLNSAFAICAGGRAESPEEGIEMARESIDSGNAMNKYEALKEFTNS
ncbi:MAG: anthranilate phosphoribosyltransferase [Candidatus Latescibacteria bacterium]|nr:anthranilate phosphoribosyltransferase [Candidatus Latescibacterota bacterium]